MIQRNKIILLLSRFLINAVIICLAIPGYSQSGLNSEIPVSEVGVKTEAADSDEPADAAVRQHEEKLYNCLSNKRLVDGIYIGESFEWTGMKVRVAIKQGEIQTVEVLAVHGSPDYYEDVVKMLPRRMQRKNTYEVDGVTGATLSTESIKSAVKLALLQALPE